MYYYYFFIIYVNIFKKIRIQSESIRRYRNMLLHKTGKPTCKNTRRMKSNDENECLDPSFCVQDRCTYSIGSGSLEEQRFVLMKRLHQLNLVIERRDMSILFRLSAY